MNDRVGVVRDNASLDQALQELDELEQRSLAVGLGERSGWANQSLAYARQVQDMIRLAKVLAASARARDECRGAHYKPAFDLPIPEGKFPGDPEFEAYRSAWKEGNRQWLKTSVASYRQDRPQIRLDEVDTRVLAPEQPRDYR
jgi:succinate dehydrogenase / fumarate reductase flavoprotein subunit